MPTAFSILPERFADGRHEAILAGLGRCGYGVSRQVGLPRGWRDVLVTWTRHRGWKERHCAAFEAAGGRVIVCEEAYIREIRGARYFALALGDHGGAGRWPDGGAERWCSFGIDLAPWRTTGAHIVVREQRGIGSTPMASPPLWHDAATRRLRQLTAREIRLRAHPRSRLYPARAGRQPSLARMLSNCHAFATWASADAVAALIAGVPVFFNASHWICAGAATRGLSGIESPALPDRLPALERLAWAQWSLAELASGAPFARLLAMD